MPEMTTELATVINQVMSVIWDACCLYIAIMLLYIVTESWWNFGIL